MAAEANGDFVVAWSSFVQDQSYRGVFARRFSSAGTALAAEFQVNASTIGAQFEPSIATDADGDFVVAWANYPEEDSDLLDIFARRFTSAGTAVAAEFLVNDFTLDEQRRPSVAGHGEGGFLVSWESNVQDTSSIGVFARRLSNAGAAIGAEFQVHTYTSGFQSAPAAAAGGEGKLVVAWLSVHDGSSAGVFAQRLAAPASLDVDGSLSLGALTDGLLLLRYLFGFRGATLVSGAVDLVNCTRCDAAAIEAHLGAGTVPLSDPEKVLRQGAEFQVNRSLRAISGPRSWPRGRDGDFVVVWTSQFQDGFDYGVFGRRFSSAGTRARRRVPGFELHAWVKRSARGGGGDQRRLRGRLVQLSSGWLQHRCLRPPLLQRGLSPRARVSGQHLHHELSGLPRGRRRRRW